MISKTIIVRIRRSSGYKGGSNYYHYADVICQSKKEALEAAKEGRIRNWRLIDRFDTTSKNYKEFEVLYKVDSGKAKNPRKPISKHQKKEEVTALKAPK